MSISILISDDTKDWLKGEVNSIDIKELRLGAFEQVADSVAKQNATNDLIWEPKSSETSGVLEIFNKFGESTAPGPTAGWTTIPFVDDWTTSSLPFGDYIFEVCVIFKTDGVTINEWGAVETSGIGFPIISSHIYYPQVLGNYSTMSSFTRLNNISGVKVFSTKYQTGASNIFFRNVRYKLYKVKDAF